MAQSYREFECIVIDDGSTDGTAKHLRQKFPTIKILEQPNSGVSAARNAGIAAAQGEWLAFLDSDDCWDADKLSRQVEFIHQHPQYKICQTDEIWIRNGKRVNSMKKHRKGEGNCFKRSLELCVISPSTVMIKRSLLDSVGVFDEAYVVCEDYELWLRITCREPVGLLPEELTTKRGGHEDQLSRSQPAMDTFRIRAIEKLLLNTSLTAEQTQQALTALEKKCTIVANGATKRGKADQAENWLQKFAELQRQYADKK